MMLKTFPSAKTFALVGLGALVCLTLGSKIFAASGEEAGTETVETPSAIIKWDKSAQTMTPVDAKQAALHMEQVRQQLTDRLIATGRFTPVDELKVETLPSGVKRLKATVDMINFAVVRVDDDGQLVQSCSTDPIVDDEAAHSSASSSETTKGDR